MKSALVLFGHGARDPRWADPFRILQGRLKAAVPDGTRVELAFLELMEPGLPGCIAGLVSQGVARVRIVPVFFGQGGHLRRDFPVLLDECRAAHPGLDLAATPPVGEWDAVLDAIVAGSLHHVGEM